MTEVSRLIRRIDPELAADVNRPHAAHILDMVDELACDLIVGDARTVGAETSPVRQHGRGGR
jgi:hypothetical protein